MFKRHQSRRSSNPLFVIFRTCLSLIMFSLLLAGIYSAYKHFSGLDPLKLNPQSVLTDLLKVKNPAQLSGILSSVGLSKIVSNGTVKQDTTKQILGQNSKPLFQFLLVADSHNDNDNLKKAIAQAKGDYPDLQFIIGLGDYTDVGTLAELKAAKSVFDLSGLRYFLIPGDHDLWDARNKQQDPTDNFKQVFGPTYQSFNFKGFKFLLLDNSDIYQGISQEEQAWISDSLDKQQGLKGVFAFTHDPLYHPSSEHSMGRVEGSLKQQAKSLIFQFKAAGVKKVFAGDIHYFSEYSEPETNLSMVTIGAITIEKNPQSPRFAVVEVGDDGSTKVDDVGIK